MTRNPMMAAIVPIMLAAGMTLTSCAGSDNESHQTGEHRSSTPSRSRQTAAAIAFNFSTREGFKYRFTGTSAFYSSTGDPNYPEMEPLPPGLTYLVLYGQLRNMLNDRPAPNPAEHQILSFGGVAIPSQTKRIPVYSTDGSGQREGTLPTCAWPSEQQAGEGDKLNTDSVPDANKEFSPEDLSYLLPVRNDQSLCVTTLGFNKNNYPSGGIPAGSSYHSAILCIIPNNLPKGSIKFAVWKTPNTDLSTDPMDAYQASTYYLIKRGSIQKFPWSAVPKLGNS